MAHDQQRDIDASERAELADFWQRRADGEWTTRAALMHIHADLTELGAPRSLLELASCAIEDESKHTIWCMNLAHTLGAHEHGAHEHGAPRVLGDRPFTLGGATPTENRFLRTVFAGCVSETIALHVLKQSHSDLAPGSVRRVNRQHMAEEVNHARLGWAFLHWASMRPGWSTELRPCLEAALPQLLALSAEAWRGGGRTVSPTLRARGMIDSVHIEHGLAQALQEVIFPGFARFEIQVELDSAHVASSLTAP
jgi:hypothetical protein